MASQGVAASSRLTQMQMRFQQKQLLEREQKRSALIGSVEANNTLNNTKTISNGKVRQMFDERRRGFGIDRSHPLKPLLTETSSDMSGKNITPTNIKVNVTNNGNSSSRTGGLLNSSQKNGQPSLKPVNNTATYNRPKRGDNIKQHSFAGMTANTTNKGRLMQATRTASNNSFRNEKFSSKEYLFNFDGMDSLDNETFPAELESVSMDNILANRTFTVGDHNNNCKENNKNIRKIEDKRELTTSVNMNEHVYSTGAAAHNNDSKKRDNDRGTGIKLNPIVVKKSPRVLCSKLNKTNAESSPRSTNNNQLKSSNKFQSPALTQKCKSPNSKIVSAPVLKDSIKTAGKINSNQHPQHNETMANSSQHATQIAPEDMGVCRYCQRRFIANRLAKHEEVCKKMANTKRKVFDVSKYRVQGTEAEQFQKKASLPLARITHAANIQRYNSLAAANNIQMQPNPAVKKNNWRKKHEEFIRAIREAKKVQAYIASGGKLSDLPPPPPSENPDYIQCPHCLRRFNEAAAERHIPKCANMKHNKPKPGAGLPGNKR